MFKSFFLKIIGRCAVFFASVVLKSVEKQVANKSAQIDECRRLIEEGKATLEYDKEKHRYVLKML